MARDPKLRRSPRLTPAERKQRAAAAAAARWGHDVAPRPSHAFADLEPAEAIMKAAMGAFSAKGFEQTTMQEIAAAAGVGLPTVYRFFPTKADLASACRSKLVEKGSLHLARLLDRNETPETQVCALAVALASGFFSQQPDRLVYLSLLDPATATLDPSLGPILKPYWDRYFEISARLGVKNSDTRIISLFALTVGLQRYSSVANAIPEIRKAWDGPEQVAALVLRTAFPEFDWTEIRRRTCLELIGEL